jgi:hypothetical protein
MAIELKKVNRYLDPTFNPSGVLESEREKQF